MMAKQTGIQRTNLNLTALANHSHDEDGKTIVVWLPQTHMD